MRTWTRKNSLGGVKVRSELDAREASVLRSLVGSVIGMLDARAAEAPQDALAELTGMRTGASNPPDDAVLARLLPEFHRPDPDEPAAGRADLNGALRSLHEPDILDEKRASGTVILNTVPERGGRVVLTLTEADAWLTGLNDVRLALGTTLGIDADTPEQLPSDDPRSTHLEVYHWLTWMQDSLLQAVAP